MLRIIALDLDGTLLNSDKKLTDRNRAALARASEMGAEIVPATGRFYKGMPQVIRELPFVRYVITINGAQVIDTRSGETVYSADIGAEEAVAFYSTVEHLPLIYDCYQDGWGYMTGSMQEAAEDYIPDIHALEMVRRLRSPVPELKAFLRERKRPVQKMQLFVRDIPLRDALLEKLAAEYPQFAVSASQSSNIEINSADADKGRALAALAKHLEIDLSQTAAFGDGRNDLTLLRTAGLGVAMGNGHESVKDAADRIAPDCDHDGVAAVLEELINEGNEE